MTFSVNTDRHKIIIQIQIRQNITSQSQDIYIYKQREGPKQKVLTRHD